MAATKIWGVGTVLFMQVTGEEIEPIAFSDLKRDGTAGVIIVDLTVTPPRAHKIALADAQDGDGAAIGANTMKEVLEHIATERG